MTKKSQARIQKDIAAGKRRPTGRTINMAPVSQRAPLQPSTGGGFKLSPADKILSECAQGLGLVPNKPKNTCWDDLLGVYRECAAALFQHTMVTEVLGDRELRTFIDDLELFNSNVKQFGDDLGQMNRELQDLYNLHHGKTGGSEDPHVVLHSFGIFEQYKLWMTKHDGVVKPTVMHILEQTNAAELRRAQARVQAQAGQLGADVPVEQFDPAVLDVNQITDVTFNDENVGQVVGAEGRKETFLELGEMPSERAAEIVNEHQLRGGKSPIVHLDEAAFYPIGTAELKEQPAV
jgi:hypothetical protein